MIHTKCSSFLKVLASPRDHDLGHSRGGGGGGGGGGFKTGFMAGLAFLALTGVSDGHAVGVQHNFRLLGCRGSIAHAES